jgi:hypothetical protein
MSRQAALEQQRAATRAQLQNYRSILAKELADARQRAAAEAEQRAAEEARLEALAAAEQRQQERLARQRALHTQAERIALQEAKERRRQQLEVAAVERHAAALAARQQELKRIAAEEAQRLQRQKQVSLVAAQRSRSASAAYEQRQVATAAARRRGVQRAREAAAAAALPGSLQGCSGATHIDYRCTRIHHLGGSLASATAAAAGGPAFGLAPRCAGNNRQLAADLERSLAASRAPRRDANPPAAPRPFTILRYDDYLRQLQAQGSPQRAGRGRG